MVIVRLKEIKSDDFDLNKLIEECYSKGEIETTAVNLENIKSAVFFKLQKIRKELIKIESASFNKALTKIKAIKITENTEIKNIIELINLIKKLEFQIQFMEFFRLKQEIKDEKIIKLIESESIEDWEFLIQVHKVTPLSQITLLIDKLHLRFERAIEEKNRVFIISIYRIYKYINLENNLISIFLLGLKIFKSVKTHPLEYKKIEIDNLNLESCWFFNYLIDVKNNFAEEIFDFMDRNFLLSLSAEEIDATKIFKKIVQKVFQEAISNNFDVFLQQNNPFIFLSCLQQSYFKIKTLISEIKNVYESYEKTVFAKNFTEGNKNTTFFNFSQLNTEFKNLFEHQFRISPRREVECFNILENILLKEDIEVEHSKKDFYILNKKTINASDCLSNVKILISYYCCFLERNSVFKYEKTDFNFVYNKFKKVLYNLLGVNEKLKVDFYDFESFNKKLSEKIEIYSKVCVILKNLVGDFDFSALNAKLQKIVEDLRKVYTQKFELLTQKITQKEFTDSKSEKYETLEKFLTNSFKNLNLIMTGTNYENFLKAVMKDFEGNYLQKVKTMKFSRIQAKNFKKQTNKIAMILEENKVEQKLSKVAALISCDISIVETIVRATNLELSEIKMYLKCREDYLEVKRTELIKFVN